MHILGEEVHYGTMRALRKRIEIMRTKAACAYLYLKAAWCALNTLTIGHYMY